VVICLERGADLHMAQLIPLPLTVSCFSKIQIGFTFLVSAHLASPGKGPLNGCRCCCCYLCVRVELAWAACECARASLGVVAATSTSTELRTGRGAVASALLDASPTRLAARSPLAPAAPPAVHCTHRHRIDKYLDTLLAMKSEATALFAPQDGRWKITVSFDGRRFCVPKFRH